MGLGIHTKNTLIERTDSVEVKKITTKAFYRRLTFQERKVLRISTLDEVIDLREDLQRGRFVKLDANLEQQLLDTALLSQTRIDELLVAGTRDETVPE